MSSSSCVAACYDSAPVAKHTGWRHLLRWLVAHVSRDLAALNQKDLTVRCLAPVTLSRWIAWQGSRPKDPRRWRLAVVGAEELDSFDGGKWFGVLPPLLGIESDVELYLIGPRLEPHSQRFPKLGPAVVGRGPAVNGFRTTLADCWADLPIDDIDLVMLFQPGFENDGQWFGGPDLRLLADAAVPVGISSYGEDEQVIDREVLAAYGFATDDKVAENPLHMEMGHPNIRWGHTLWQLAGTAPGPEFAPDRERLDEIHALSRLLARLFHAGFVNRPLEFGRVRDLEMRGERRRLVYLLADVYVDAASGRVWRERRDGWQETDIRLSGEVLRARPAERASSLDGALWALKATAPIL